MLKDPWIQVFGFLALVSGAFMVEQRLAAVGPAAPPSAGAAASASPFALAEPPAVGPARFQPAAAPAPAPIQAAPSGGVSLGLKPKVPGRWLIDAAGASDADAAKLPDVVASAADGDVVLIRPGFYGDPVVVSRSITLRGLGADKTAVTLGGVGPLTLAVGGGRARLENLTVANSGGQGATALAVSKAELTLVDVAVKAPDGQAMRASGGSIDASRCDVSGRIAVIGEADSKLKLADCSVAGSEAGVLVKAQNGPVEVSVARTHFHDSERAVNLEGDARATIESSDFQLSAAGGGVFLFDGASAEIRDAKFELGEASQVGLYAQKATLNASKVSIRSSAGAGVIANQSNVTLDAATLEYNKDCGVKLDGGALTLRRSTVRHNRCGVAFQSPACLEADDSVFSDNALGPLAAKPGVESQIKLAGSGNTGVQIGDFAAQPPAPAAPAAPQPQRQAPVYHQPVQFTNDVFGQYKRRRF